jgi:predicted secreted hydrolase
MSLTVSPRLKDQELITSQSTDVTYWEGSVSVAGTVAGHRVTGSGYVELTGYAAGFDPAFQGF